MQTMVPPAQLSAPAEASTPTPANTRRDASTRRVNLVIWALGALYLATRAKAGGIVSFNLSTGLLR